jgi:hypothetical protein
MTQRASNKREMFEVRQHCWCHATNSRHWQLLEVREAQLKARQAGWQVRHWHLQQRAAKVHCMRESSLHHCFLVLDKHGVEALRCMTDPPMSVPALRFMARH